MFSQLNLGSSRRWRVLAASLAAHGAALIWMLYPSEPMLLNPRSIAIGRNGTSLTRLYWPNPNPDQSKATSSPSATQKYRHERLGHETLTWRPNPQPANLPALPVAQTAKQDNSQTQTLSSLGHGAPAGLAYGTLNRGTLYGDEIRPALPVVTSDPVVYPWQLPDTPGNEVIEITIDEQGEIIKKTVLQSLGPAIDEKCLAALEGWHFHPATKNGSPIPSKQDAIFPFRARG